MAMFQKVGSTNKTHVTHHFGHDGLIILGDVELFGYGFRYMTRYVTKRLKKARQI